MTMYTAIVAQAAYDGLLLKTASSKALGAAPLGEYCMIVDSGSPA